MTGNKTAARCLITGATGFVGGALVRELLRSGRYSLVCAGRRPVPDVPETVHQVQVSGLTADTDWAAALDDVAVVVHCAARVHIMKEQSRNPLAEFRRVNVDGTVQLARQAAQTGARRFVLVSTVKVHGEASLRGRPFTAANEPAPADDYALSKLEAERALQAIAAETGMEAVIVRPPLVYGPGVGANFRAMMGWLHRGVPLPLGRTGNLRSLVALENLTDLLVTCLDHPKAAGEVFLVSDGEDLSTTELLQRLGQLLGKPARLLSLSPEVLRLGARLLGREAVAQRLCDSLQVSITATCQRLNWRPPISLDEALAATVRHYLESL